MRYHMELILSFPLVALTMAIYFKLSFKKNSSVQNPEKLYREPMLMASFVATSAAMLVLIFTRMPALETFFMPTLSR